MDASDEQDTEALGGERYVWAQPVREGAWTDPDGVVWRRRGGPLEPRVARKFMRRPDLIVVHAYDVEPHVVDGADAAELLTRVQQFLDGDAPGYSEFVLADFRDADRRPMLVVEERC